MTQLVFFVEEPSIKEMLKGLIPRLLNDEFELKFIVFEGKQDLDKKIEAKLRAWQYPALFVIIRDQDSGDCVRIKKDLQAKCHNAKKKALIRIACRELESWYLGDLKAVANTFGPRVKPNDQNKTKYKTPDNLGNPFQVLKKIAPGYQKLSGSREIGKSLSLENNCSKSFEVFLSGVRDLTKKHRALPQTHPSGSE